MTWTADELNRNRANKYTQNIDAFLGLRNVAQSRRQPVGALHEAINVDIDDEGGILSRTGYVPSLTMTAVTAAFTPLDHQTAYLVDNGHAKRVYPDGTVIDLGAVRDGTVYWAEAGDRVFMSTGHTLYNNSVFDLIVLPPNAPSISVIPGSFQEGQYQVITTRVTADGRESGSSVVTVMYLAAGSGIYLQGVEGCNVYLTAANGDVFYFVGYETSQVVDEPSVLAYPIEDVLITANPIPYGLGPIAYYDSCLYYSKYDQTTHTTLIGWSKPFRWHVCDASADYFQVPGEVRMLAVADGALVIGTDRQILTYDGESIQKVAAYGVPKGHVASYTRDGQLFFQSKRGVCTMPFANLTLDKVALPVEGNCATALIDLSGFERLITLTDGKGRTDNSTI